MLALLTSRQCRSCSVDDIVAGVVVFLIMASKKSTPKKSGSDTPNKRMARAAAGEAIAKYVDSPTNRAQVINPRNYPEGSDGYYMKTAGRFRAGTQIADKVYKETLDRLNKTIPKGSKSVSGSVKKASKKK
jgi:hypothetical protein